jgi:hypothetical protein
MNTARHAFLACCIPLLLAACSTRRSGRDTGDGGSPFDHFGADTEEGADDGCAWGCNGGDAPDDGNEPSGGDQGAEASTSSGASTGTAAEICVATINDYRASLGLPPYQRWGAAEGCSDVEAESDAQTQTPHGAFGQCREWAQNECPGWEGPAEQMIVECLAAMWSEGPGGGHYEAMASNEYTRVACGFHATGAGEVWSVQNFQ